MKKNSSPKATTGFSDEKFKDAQSGNSTKDLAVEVDAAVKKGARGMGATLRTKHIAVSFYSLDEAMALVRDKGVTTARDYKILRKDFPLLPKNPFAHYGEQCKSWNELFGVPELYSTLDAAGKAAQALGIKGALEYRKRRYEDPRLPHDPISYYRDFPGFSVFLGVGQVSYATYEEASEAAIRLGIVSRDYYVRRRKQDPKLPASPVKLYSDVWEGWPHFLKVAPKLNKLQRANKGYYSTYQEFKEAVKTFGIKGQKEYAARFSENPMLPPDPSAFYDEDWEGWGKALGSRRAAQCSTWQEAKAIALPYRFTSATEYIKG